MIRYATLALAIGAASSLPAAAPVAPADLEAARELLRGVDFRGGLIVQLGCGDGRQAAALQAAGQGLVQCLDRDPAARAAARRHVESGGRYGPVTIAPYSGAELPFIDNTVNLLIAEQLGDVSREEALRVVAPGGALHLREGDRWTTVRKPRPDTIDDWTHYLHDPSGNAVAHDTEVGPPRHLQWLGAPRWSRHHDRMASLSAMVSTGGRIFYIMDEGSRISIQLPARWRLVARDAFNGVELWKVPITTWHNHLWPLKSGPTQLARRLVAVGGRVYVTLGLDAPLSAIDAATGEILQTYEGTQATEEVLAMDDGTLLLLVNPNESELTDYNPKLNLGDQRRVAEEYQWNEQPRKVMSIDAASGKVLWSRVSSAAPLSLTAARGKVMLHNGAAIVCLDQKSGEPLWSSDAPRRERIQMNFGVRVVVHGDVALCSGGDGKLRAFDLKSGQPLWEADKPPSGYQSPEDLLIAGGLVWTAPTTRTQDSGIFVGRDPRTGEVKEEFAPGVSTYWFHHRCYIAKATDRFLIPSRTGTEFVDYAKGEWDINHWVRGGCLYGVMPCNGLLYTPPHNCACYPEAKLYGFNALASSTASRRAMVEPGPERASVERGPAFGAGDDQRPAASDWPTYRHDGARSGATSERVSPDVEEAWRRDLGGRLTSPVVANGRLLVSRIDQHQVVALREADGETLWTFPAGGRVDSPPTLAGPWALFGATDGCVYCLRAADGELAWKFHAAPRDRRLVSLGQVESLWPVHGSVLVEDRSAYFVAGRSNFLDGGLHWYRVDVESGKLLHSSVIDDKNPATGNNLQETLQVLNMPVGLPDVLSSDGRRIYMRSQPFDHTGQRTELGPHSGVPAAQGAVQAGETAHLFAPMGFLDDTWFHRSYWVYGRSFAGGHGGYYQAGKYAPSGRLLVFDDKNVYGFGRKPEYLKWTTTIEHQLFSASKDAPQAPPPGPAASRRTAAPLIRVPNSPKLNPAGKPLTIEAWVRADRPNGVIAARGGPAEGFAIVLKNGMPQFCVRSGGTLYTATSEQRVTGKWAHVAGVLTDNRELQLYVDGELKASAAGALIANNPKQGMEIGADDGGSVGDYPNPNALTGAVDEVRLYFSALSAEELRQSAGGKPASGAALAYAFDEGDAADSSGNEHHGKLFGAKPVRGQQSGGMALAGAGRRGAAAAPAAKSFVEPRWTQDVPLLVRAMVLAGDTLFIAGPPDLINEEQTFQQLVDRDPQVQQQLARQDESLDGRHGAALLVVSKQTGRVLRKAELPALPVWDGMIAAQQRIYLSTVDGAVRCFALPQ